MSDTPHNLPAEVDASEIFSQLDAQATELAALRTECAAFGKLLDKVLDLEVVTGDAQTIRELLGAE